MDIIHYENQGFYIYDENKNIIAELNYKRVENKMIIDHTEVSEVLKGQGIARKLFEEAVEYARKNNLKIDPVCSYIQAQLSNEMYDDLKI